MARLIFITILFELQSNMQNLLLIATNKIMIFKNNNKEYNK
jgi:hypothetical protein